MNLVIDIGNTSAKAALYDAGLLVKKGRLSSADRASIANFTGSYEIENAIVSSVNRSASEIVAHLPGKIKKVHVLTWQSKYPFTVDYETPETLGVDRLAAAAGAVMYHPGHDILVIDAGSAVTYDIVAGGVFMGGSISPGLGMRFRALHQFTERLPLVEYNDSFTLPGRSTNDAITGGVVKGLSLEVKGFISHYRERYNDIAVIITGGDAEILKKNAQSEMHHYPDLVTDGLNYLLGLNDATKQ